MGRPCLFDEMSDSCGTVVDRQQKRSQTQLGKCDLEQAFIDGRRNKHGDDALVRDRGCRGIRLKVRVVRTESIDGTLDLGIGEGLQGVVEGCGTSVDGR